MTVSELIEELKQFPPHCVMMLVVPGSDPTSGPQSDYFFIEDVQIESNVGDIGNVVKLISPGAE